MTKPRKPAIPRERHETVRQSLIALLRQETLSAKELSALIGLAEKEVYSQLEEINRNRRDHRLLVTPAVCRACGFVFEKRDRLTKPGKCPVCRGEAIEPPLFRLAGSHHKPLDEDLANG